MTSNDAAPSLRALVVYETIYGCAEQIATAVAQGLEHAGAAVDLRDVAAGADPPAYDLLVVGAPAHAFSLSRPSTRRDGVTPGAGPGTESRGLREWIETLGRRVPADGRAVAAFDTRMSRVRYLPTAAAPRASHLLAHHGYRPVVPPMGFVVTDLRGPLAAGEEARAERWGRQVHDAAATVVRPPTLRPDRDGRSAGGRR